MARKRQPALEPNLREARFVAAYVADPECNASRAAVAAGYSIRNAASRAHEIMKRSRIRAAIEAARREITERGHFSAEVAMRRLDSAAQFARDTGNATALARCIELQLRLHGMLIDKAQIQVERVDLMATLIEARKRSFPTAEYEAVPNPFD
ncbi:MAG: terminase small subunit [Betaproteobacteria bacterium]|nr:terminase small subunit [Betaproteobacteria bacterium]